MKGFSKEDKLSLGYDLESVQVNRVKFYFDFEKMQVAIGTSVKNAEIYKIKKIRR